MLPGNRQEMLDYETKAASCTLLHVDLNIPSANVCLHDKHFLEVIYNRCVAKWLVTEALRVCTLYMYITCMFIMRVRVLFSTDT